MSRLSITFSCALLALTLGCSSRDGDPTMMMMPPPPPVECDYPEFSGELALGEVMPDFKWEALNADGTPVTIDFAEFHCSPEYDEYNSIVMVVSAGWCSACPGYIEQIDGMADGILAGGALLLYLEVETSDFEPATSEAAAEFIDGIIMGGPGIRAGDADNEVMSAVRPRVSRMPSGFFVRRRDMVITADQRASTTTINYGDLANDPEGEWTPTLPPFEANCLPTDEEASEPNDTIETAAPMADGEMITGGICMEGPDYFRIDIDGPWRLDIYTDIFMGDLNLNLYNIVGERIGGATQRANHDWIDYQGPALVEVFGANNDSNTYRLEVSSR